MVRVNVTYDTVPFISMVKNAIIPDIFAGRFEPGKVIDSTLSTLSEKLDAWLADYSEDERQIFLKLFSKYIYYSEPKMLESWQSIADSLGELISSKQLEWSEVLFVSTESSKGSKSGAANVQADFMKFAQEFIGTDQFVTSIEEYKKFKVVGSKNISAKKLIVFLDDVAGTGGALEETFAKFFARNQEYLEQNSNVEFLWACPLYSRSGQARLAECSIGSTRIEQVDAGALLLQPIDAPAIISPEEIAALSDIEKKVAPNPEMIMGYKESKLIVSTYYNTPNNTLSVFWHDTEQNKSIFRRKNHIPSLDDLKQKKQTQQDTAYTVAIVKKSAEDML